MLSTVCSRPRPGRWGAARAVCDAGTKAIDLGSGLPTLHGAIYRSGGDEHGIALVRIEKDESSPERREQTIMLIDTVIISPAIPRQSRPLLHQMPVNERLSTICMSYTACRNDELKCSPPLSSLSFRAKHTPASAST